jgi:hypothetical protein
VSGTAGFDFQAMSQGVAVARDRDPLVGHSPFRRRFASIEAAAVAGIICAVGWSLSVRGLLAAPGIGASDAEIEHFYADASASRLMMVWLQVLVFSTIAFLWFVGVIRSRLGDREPKLFGTVFFGASVLLAGSSSSERRSWPPHRSSSWSATRRRVRMRYRSLGRPLRSCCRCSLPGSPPW